MSLRPPSRGGMAAPAAGGPPPLTAMAGMRQFAPNAPIRPAVTGVAAVAAMGTVSMGTRVPGMGGLAMAPPGMRPPSAGPGGRPGTGMRVPTAAGMVAGAAPGSTLGLTANVRLEARPVTQQGLTAAPGMQKIGVAHITGPARQVADKGYYMQELRNKIGEITSEMESLQTEATRVQTDSALYGRLERKYDDTVREVRGLEGQLADFNLALDKMRTNANVEEIAELQMRLQQHNEEERHRADEIFVRRTAAEKDAAQLEAELTALHRAASERLSELGEGPRAEYASLQQQALSLVEELNAKDTRLMELEGRIRLVRHQTEGDAYRIHQRATELGRKRAELERKKRQLSDECSTTLSPEEMREQLLQRVKEKNAEIRTSESTIQQLEQAVEQAQERVKEKESEVEECKKHSQKSKKYEALYERDRKMQEFLDRFAENKQTELANQAKLQQTIVALLEHASKGIHKPDNASKNEKLAELKDELTFKQQKMKNSETTLDVLKKEVEKRRNELSKISTLDEKIGKELLQLQERVDSMRVEMKTFKGPEELKTEADNKKKELTIRKMQARQAKESLSSKILELKHAHEAKSKELGDNELMKKLNSLQQKLRAYAQTAFQLQEYINSHKREGDYETLVREVTVLTEHINTATVARVR